MNVSPIAYVLTIALCLLSMPSQPRTSSLGTWHACQTCYASSRKCLSPSANHSPGVQLFYIYTYTYIYIHIHTYIHIYICISIHTNYIHDTNA